jgi:hypothetical protein
MSLEMAHKVIVPPKKNYIPQFLKQRDINSYKSDLEIYERDPDPDPNTILLSEDMDNTLNSEKRIKIEHISVNTVR